MTRDQDSDGDSPPPATESTDEEESSPEKVDRPRPLPQSQLAATAMSSWPRFQDTTPGLIRIATQAMKAFENPLLKDYQLSAFRVATDTSARLTGLGIGTGQFAAHEATLRIAEHLTRWDLGLAEDAQRFAGQYSHLQQWAAEVLSTMEGLQPRRLLPGVQAAMSAATRGLDLAARVVPETPAPLDMLRLEAATRTTYGAVTSGALLVADVDQEDAAHVEDVPPWAPTPPRLRQVLAEVHPDLPVRLDGVIERAEGGADAASQAANSLVECLDWALRLSATDEEVLAWHAATGRDAKEVSEGRPTRALRVRYLVRGRANELAAAYYVKSINDLLNTLQGVKHGPDAPSRSPAAVKALVPAATAFLCYVLIDDELEDP